MVGRLVNKSVQLARSQDPRPVWHSLSGSGVRSGSSDARQSTFFLLGWTWTQRHGTWLKGGSNFVRPVGAAGPAGETVPRPSSVGRRPKSLCPALACQTPAAHPRNRASPPGSRWWWNVQATLATALCSTTAHTTLH